ncbi:phBC6A51 family helix-turn-helix protein [Paenibacillus sp. J5C_2022]|uniref:phBC6A51 family helix-turn-helix protein n=1 Tax=Paenibacillus sp. J5C2022 TaxID=2977129 RepID=UPI0021D36C87|nr:phBC6A51 family helix-turn-helix protein [Paenibacillus sp. J5C2022]MCU6709775.1 phBC6A51 family helix-turn-helix protein [Paenibacillus sp. J5C2022]
MLKPEQYTAIEWLIQPKHGGKTLEEIAALCGVSRQTLHAWRRTDEFNTELRAEVKRYTSDRLGGVMDAMLRSAIDNKSAAAAKLILQANAMLTDKVEVETKQTDKTTDVEALRQRLEALKARQSER